MEIKPQAGPQSQFMSCNADIIFYGGHAGGGKTWCLVAEPLRWLNKKNFGGVIFRRNATQIMNVGALWDEARAIYGPCKIEPNKSARTWTYNDDWKMQFTHLEFDETVFDHQGAQYAYQGWDELTHFTRRQFFYMLTRGRSISGINPYVRGTCNPDADSWVREFIDWYVGPDGYIIPERSGVVRYLVVIEDRLIWGNTREELLEVYKPEDILSFCFIESKLEDNKILLEKDPRYIAKLNAQDRVQRARLRGGNWNIRYSAGSLFKREWFPVIDAIPSGWRMIVRFWDRAATKPHPQNPDPDWTRGLKMYAYPDGTYVVADLRSMRDTPGEVEKLIKNVASHDTASTRVKSQQDPGSAGVKEAQHFSRMLAGYAVETEVFNKKGKIDRAKPVSAQAEHGNVRVLRAAWNKDFFDELESFPEGKHDDIVDTLSGAFNTVATGASSFDFV